jgi:hypothetical protein
MPSLKWTIPLIAVLLLASCQGAAVAPGAAPTATAVNAATAVNTATAVPTAAPTTPPAASATPVPAGGKAIPTSVEQVPRISPQDLRSVLNAGANVIVLDARSREAYDHSHIPGAQSMPLDEVEARYQQLPQGAKIVTYCT